MVVIIEKAISFNTFSLDYLNHSDPNFPFEIVYRNKYTEIEFSCASPKFKI